jgi:hypothetical protein
MTSTQPRRSAVRRPGIAAAVALLWALLGSIALAQDKAPTAGTIELVQGDVLIKAKAGASRLAKVNEPVMEGDTIVTFDKAELHLRMADRAYLAVRENSQLTITTYIANGDEGDRSIIDLAKGAFRSVTGWIGEFGLKAKTAEGRKAYQVRTPLVTIGVRGTDHEPTHLPPGDARGEAGSYDRVYSGKAVMQTSQGTIEVPPNRAAFHSAAGARAKPRLLASLPAFFVPRAHERRFIERSREERRNLARERAARHEAARIERRAGKATRPAAPRQGGAGLFTRPHATQQGGATLFPHATAPKPAAPRPNNAPKAQAADTHSPPPGASQQPGKAQTLASPQAARTQQPVTGTQAPTSGSAQPPLKTPQPSPPQNGKRLAPAQIPSATRGSPAPQYKRDNSRQAAPQAGKPPRPVGRQDAQRPAPERRVAPPRSSGGPKPVGKGPPAGGRGRTKPVQ